MKVTDLTHLITENMPVYPGTDSPKIFDAFTMEKNGFREKCLTMFSHTGTHIDAPAHMLHGKTLDDFPTSQFIGPALIIEADSYEIGIEYFKPYEDLLHKYDFVILKTGWETKWGTNDYFSNFPAITKDAAEYLTTFGLKGFGIDAISVDHIENTDFSVHKVLLSNNMILIENLKNLDQINNGDLLSVLPLKIEASDGSPVRAVAIKNKNL
jgi:kynurenine formamidase